MTTATTKEAYLSEAKEVEAGTGYKVVAKGTEGATFTVERNKEGEIKRTCAPEKAGTGCPKGDLVAASPGPWPGLV